MAMTIEEIEKAINDFYGDTTRSRRETKDHLDDLIGTIELLVESLDDADQLDSELGENDEDVEDVEDDGEAADESFSLPP